MLFQLSSENWEQDCLSLLLKCWELGVLAKAKRLHVLALVIAEVWLCTVWRVLYKVSITTAGTKKLLLKKVELSLKSLQIKSVTVNGHFKWIRMFSVIGVVWNCKFQFLEMRIFLIQNVTCLVIMCLWKELCRDVIDEIQQPAQTGIEINFHFHQSNSFYDNVLEFCGVCA